MIDGQNVVGIPLTEAGASEIDEGAHSQLSVWASNPSYRTLRDGSRSAEIQALRARTSASSVESLPSFSPCGTVARMLMHR
jgi:hypothetical protein